MKGNLSKKAYEDLKRAFPAVFSAVAVL